MSNLKTIILDCAHGKETPGKRSPDSSFFEYEWSRMMQYRIAELLGRKQIPYVLIPSKGNNKEIGLNNRVSIFNELDNAFVFSLHSNAAGDMSKWMSARGVESYSFEKSTISKKFSEQIYNAVKGKFPDINGTFNYNRFWRGCKEARFTVLRSKHPSILFEWLFQDNKADVEILLNEETNQYLAECLASQLELISLGVDKIPDRKYKEKRV